MGGELRAPLKIVIDHELAIEYQGKWIAVRPLTVGAARHAGGEIANTCKPNDACGPQH